MSIYFLIKLTTPKNELNVSIAVWWIDKSSICHPMIHCACSQIVQNGNQIMLNFHCFRFNCVMKAIQFHPQRPLKIYWKNIKQPLAKFASMLDFGAASYPEMQRNYRNWSNREWLDLNASFVQVALRNFRMSTKKMLNWPIHIWRIWTHWLRYV